MEQFDIVDEAGVPTGAVCTRKQAHQDGIRHRTAHVWVIRRETAGIRVLLQKRAQNKDSFPGCYDTSSAGHIQAGDEPLQSALRELSEELGIWASAEDLHPAGRFRSRYEEVFYGEIFRDNEVSFVYVYDRPVEIGSLQLQQEEVEAAAWFDLKELLQRMAADDPQICVPPNGIKTLCRYLGEEPYLTLAEQLQKHRRE